MSKPRKAPLVVEGITPEEFARVTEIAAVAKAAIMASLPEADRELRRRHARAMAKARDDRYKVVETERIARNKRIMELLGTAYSQAEIARTLNVDQNVVSYCVRRVWPFPTLAGRDNRYIVPRINRQQIEALDGLAADLNITRIRALEEIMAFALESDAFIARRSLHAQRKPKTNEPL